MTLNRWHDNEIEDQAACAVSDAPRVRSTHMFNRHDAMFMHLGQLPQYMALLIKMFSRPLSISDMVILQ